MNLDLGHWLAVAHEVLQVVGQIGNGISGSFVGYFSEGLDQRIGES